ncbi:MAG: hypothetical protein RL651_267 [Pseudomonadota bacterium]|jgi:hypothetical protein
MLSRLEIRPVASRRLRAALLLVLSLAGLSLSQSSLSGHSLAVVGFLLLAVFVQAWRTASLTPPPIALAFKPIKAFLIDFKAADTPIRCTRLSVYPWLILLHVEIPQQGRQVIVLLPDSLPDRSVDQWRKLLVWAKRMRRQIATQ